MATERRTRSERIELRATSEEKQLLADAAAADHSDLTSFVMRSALRAAEERLAHVEQITLNREEAVRLMELLDRPPNPSPAMIEAARRYRESLD